VSARPGRRGRFRRRPGTTDRPPSAPAPASPPPPPAASRRSRLTLLLALLAGILIGRFAFALLPAGARGLFDFAVAGAFALVLTMTYRRYMRRYMAEQRRRR